MKNLFLSVAVLLMCAFSAIAQVTTTYFEGKDAFKSLPALRQQQSKEISTKRMPKFDTEKLLWEDRENEGMDIPYRFGYGFDVSYSLNDGTWEELDSVRIWSLKISSPGAYSLNFIFEELWLCQDAQLYIFNTEGSMVYGPVTEKQNIKSGKFLTSLLVGDEVIIQLTEPFNSKEKSALKISKVIHAYQNSIWCFLFGIGCSSSNSCPHNDINCYPEWSNESDAVAMVLVSSSQGEATALCTGSLLNNTAQDYRPFFLTAFHCIDIETNWFGCPDRDLSPNEIAMAEEWLFQFRYKKTSCNGSATSTIINYNGADLRAAWHETDFALMELRQPVYDAPITFLGWDRSGAISSKGTGIHHPGGQPMKISFDNHSLVTNGNILEFGNEQGDICYSMPANRHWAVGFDNGTC